MRKITKYKGSIKLSAIGDALGWITEFEQSLSDIKDKYKVERITTFHEWTKYVGGRFNGYKDRVKKGSYSDDTQLLLAVARSIRYDGTVDNEYFSKVELPAWLSYSRGAGRTIKNAARKIQRKSVKWYNNFFKIKVNKREIDYRDTGANGAAMRILPIALANFNDPEKINAEIFYNSIITHGHPRAILGAMLYGFAINTILKFTPDTFDYKLFLTELGKNIEEKLSIKHIINKKEIQEWLSAWNKGSKIDFISLYKDTITETQNFLRHIYKGITKNINDNIVYENLGCLKSETKGSGISTVIAGIYLASKYFRTPIKAIEIAVNKIGSDTDSIAAFTGGLLGALHGQSIIPQKWKKIQDYDYLDKVAERLLRISEENLEPQQHLFEVNNNINNIKKLDLSTDNYEVNEQIYFKPLGKGVITNIERQETSTKGKYNLVIDIDFEIGQSCRFARLLSTKDKTSVKTEEQIDLNERIKRFRRKLNKDDQIEFDKIIRLVKNRKNSTQNEGHM